SIRTSGRTSYTSSSITAPSIPAIAPTAAAPSSGSSNVQHDDRMLEVLERLDSKLDNLQVYFGGHDYEKFREGLSDFAKQNNEALISYDTI
ncbi:MAG TPA: hypothetical protein VGE24_14965, partial [Emticicia sp.]